MINIRENTKENTLLWKRIFSNYKYSLLAFLIASAFFILNVFIQNIRNFNSLYDSLGFLGSLKLLLTISINFNKIVSAYAFYSLVAISILTGILISILSYKFNFSKSSNNKNLGFFASIGLFFGVIAPGCASCGIGILAIFGLSSSLAVLPFRGLELSVLAIIILGFSILKISENICGCEACSINIKN